MNDMKIDRREFIVGGVTGAALMCGALPRVEAQEEKKPRELRAGDRVVYVGDVWIADPCLPAKTGEQGIVIKIVKNPSFYYIIVEFDDGHSWPFHYGINKRFVRVLDGPLEVGDRVVHNLQKGESFKWLGRKLPINGQRGTVLGQVRVYGEPRLSVLFDGQDKPWQIKPKAVGITKIEELTC